MLLTIACAGNRFNRVGLISAAAPARMWYNGDMGSGLIWCIAFLALLAAGPTSAETGDIDLDGRVDIHDLVRYSSAHGSIPADQNWDAACDLDQDSAVGFNDASVLGANFGYPYFTAQHWQTVDLDTNTQLYYGPDTQLVQYGALEDSGTLRLVYPGGSWGSGTILLPAYWSQGDSYHQWGAITASCDTSGIDLLIQFDGQVDDLSISGSIRLAPPGADTISAVVTVDTVIGSVTLSDTRAGERFKPCLLSSMWIASDTWDCQTAETDTASFSILDSGWIINPAVVGREIALIGGSSVWKTNAVTVEIQTDTDCQITGWVSPSSNPYGGPNVGYWLATDDIIRSWSYIILVKP